MEFEKFQLRGNNSMCAGACQLLRGRASGQLRGNIDYRKPITHILISKNPSLRKCIFLSKMLPIIDHIRYQALLNEISRLLNRKKKFM
jgi:hypothetical protein